MFDQEWQSEKIERHLLAAAVIPFGISFLDDALYGILPNELMLVGARTGRGKTELATSIAVNAASKHRNVMFFALEADKWEIQRRIKYRKLAQAYHENYSGSSLKFPRMREWLVKGFDRDWEAIEKMVEQDIGNETSTLQIAYKGAKYSVDQFCSEIEALKDIDLIIVDHLHYFDLVGSNETEGLKKAIHAIRSAAIHHGKPVVLLAHLRKSDKSSTKVLPDLDDFHGHSDIVKVATTVLLMAPADAHGELGVYPTYFHVAKCRTAAEVTPFAAVHGFDFKSNNYSQKYILEKASFFKDPEPIEGDFPEWAKRAIKPRNQHATRPRISSGKNQRDYTDRDGRD